MLKSNPGIGLTITNLHNDTLSYLNRINTNGGSITHDDIKAVDTFVKAIYAAGLRNATTVSNSLIRYFCPYAGNNLKAALANLWYPAQTAGSKEINTATGFVESDYSRTTGLKGGAGKSLGTGFNPSLNLAATGVGLGLYCRTDIPSGESSDIFSETSESASLSLYLRWSDNVMYATALDQTTTLTNTPTSCIGWVCTSRVSSTHSLYIRGTPVASNMLAGGSLPNSEVLSALTSKSIGCASIQRGLTAAQVTNYTNLVNNLMTAFERNV
jgi:hypothetical protein